MKILGKGLLALVGALVLAVPAQADIAWLVHGVFDDGATLDGTFYLNQYGFLSDVEMVTQAKGSFVSVDYLKGSNIYVNNGDAFIELDQLNYNGGLRLNFDGDITLTSPGLSLLPSSWECQNSTSCSAQTGQGITRHLVSGSAVNTDPQPIPEPASWALMIGGFGMVGMALRGRHRSAISAR